MSFEVFVRPPSAHLWKARPSEIVLRHSPLGAIYLSPALVVLLGWKNHDTCDLLLDRAKRIIGIRIDGALTLRSWDKNDRGLALNAVGFVRWCGFDRLESSLHLPASVQGSMAVAALPEARA